MSGEPPLQPRTWADLAELGVADRSACSPATRPTVLRLLPDFWGEFRRILVIEGGVVRIFSLRRLSGAVKAELGAAEVGRVTTRRRLGNHQLLLELPNRQRAVIDGRGDVARALALLGRPR